MLDPGGQEARIWRWRRRSMAPYDPVNNSEVAM
jgi:hypothetical protein